jgi:hypothetical protein
LVIDFTFSDGAIYGNPRHQTRFMENYRYLCLYVCEKPFGINFGVNTMADVKSSIPTSSPYVIWESIRS